MTVVKNSGKCELSYLILGSRRFLDVPNEQGFGAHVDLINYDQ